MALRAGLGEPERCSGLVAHCEGEQAHAVLRVSEAARVRAAEPTPRLTGIGLSAAHAQQTESRRGDVVATFGGDAVPAHRLGDVL